ncbi:hypothetical protein VTH06DRAFT_381 [Thermothelomyces fergusii]
MPDLETMADRCTGHIVCIVCARPRRDSNSRLPRLPISYRAKGAIASAVSGYGSSRVAPSAPCKCPPSPPSPTLIELPDPVAGSQGPMIPLCLISQGNFA